MSWIDIAVVGSAALDRDRDPVSQRIPSREETVAKLREAGSPIPLHLLPDNGGAPDYLLDPSLGKGNLFSKPNTVYEIRGESNAPKIEEYGDARKRPGDNRDQWEKDTRKLSRLPENGRDKYKTKKYYRDSGGALFDADAPEVKGQIPREHGVLQERFDRHDDKSKWIGARTTINEGGTNFISRAIGGFSPGEMALLFTGLAAAGAYASGSFAATGTPATTAAAEGTGAVVAGETGAATGVAGAGTQAGAGFTGISGLSGTSAAPAGVAGSSLGAGTGIAPTALGLSGLSTVGAGGAAPSVAGAGLAGLSNLADVAGGADRSGIAGDLATIGAGLIGTKLAGDVQTGAAETAAAAQTEAARLGIGEQRRQFDAMQQLLSPYTQAGEGTLGAQMALLGFSPEAQVEGQPQQGGFVRDPEAQRGAIAGLEAMPHFQALTRQGEEAILQSQAATGGLRGGNVQGALAQFRPAMLNQLIESQYAKLGGITRIGQASAAGVGAGGQATGVNIANLLGQSGEAQAQSALTAGNVQAGQIADLAGGIGAGIALL